MHLRRLFYARLGFLSCERKELLRHTPVGAIQTTFEPTTRLAAVGKLAQQLHNNGATEFRTYMQQVSAFWRGVRLCWLIEHACLVIRAYNRLWAIVNVADTLRPLMSGGHVAYLSCEYCLVEAFIQCLTVRFKQLWPRMQLACIFSTTGVLQILTVTQQAVYMVQAYPYTAYDLRVLEVLAAQRNEVPTSALTHAAGLSDFEHETNWLQVIY